MKTTRVLFNLILLYFLTIFLTNSTSQVQAQTAAVTFSGPGASDQDDMAIWVHPNNPSASTVIGSDKNSNKIYLYNLSGNTLQTLTTPDQPGNIDVRYDFPLGGNNIDIVGVNQRAGGYKILLYEINSANGQLTQVDNGITTGENYGFCLYRSSTSGKYYGFTTSKAGNIEQYELKDAGGGKIGGTKVRNWNLAKSEGCVADDENKWLYISDERNGIWKYGAEPTDSTTGTKIASVGQNGLSTDVEGLTIYHTANGGGYLIASSQGSSNFKVYNRLPPHSYITTFSIGTSSTDGIDVANVNFSGTNFTQGIFTAHNGGQASTMKGVKWQDIAASTNPRLTIDTSWNPRGSAGPQPTSPQPTYPQPTSPQPTTPQPSSAQNLPDLTIIDLKISLETGNACINSNTPLVTGVRVLIKNIGNADAGLFEVEANGVKKTVDAGLAAGQFIYVWGFGNVYGGQQATAKVDPTNVINESNENNNSFTTYLAIPTLPPLCNTITPTPPVTSGSCPLKSQGDANCDGNINLNDYDLWRAEFNGRVPTRNADFNGDNRVTLVDFEAWRRSFTSTLPQPISTTPNIQPTHQTSPIPTSIPNKTPTTTPQVSAKPDFTLTASPNQQTMGLTGSINYTAELTFLNGFNSISTDMWVTGIPAGVTAEFEPDPMPHQGKSRLTLTGNGTTAARSYTLIVGATAQGITHSQPVTLVLINLPDFALSVAPVTQSVTSGNSVSYNVTLSAINNFSNPITFSVTGLPSGATASFNPNPATPSQTSVLTVTTSGSSPTGTYNLNITGTKGSLTRTTQASLIVSRRTVWDILNIGSTGADNNTVRVGQLRNDGVNRLYGGTVSTGRVFEMSWNGSSWSTPTDIGGSPSGREIHNMGLGTGRNDGVNRLYACSVDGAMYEISWNGTSWSQATIGNPDGGCFHPAIGNVRNDGINRLYAVRGTGVYEYTWNGSGWNTVLIGRVSGGVAHGITIGRGRNDNTNRLYIASTGSGTYEASSTPGGFTMTSMGDTGDVRNTNVGIGRNDGVNRVYSATANGQVRELTWNGSSWTSNHINRSIGITMVHAYALDGRGDGVNRVYSSAGNGNVYEHSWNGSTWTTTTLGGGSGYMYGFHYGLGRNDAKIRLYGASFNQQVYEYSF